MAFGSATTGARNTAQPGQNQSISYLRNSVKATVDAYNGNVTLYAFDDSDPVLKTWMKAFPGSVQPSTAISPSLRSHLRYPEDQFKVQRELLTRYHVGNPGEFYGGVSFWDVPTDPTVQSGAAGAAQPPYYVLAGAPGAADAGQPTFQLTSALVFKNRDILSSYVSASSDPASYGKITVLQLPSDTQTLGPQQVQSQFISSPTVSSNISLLSRGQTAVDYGNLLTLPVAGGLLYVEPIYIERTGQASSYPQLARCSSTTATASATRRRWSRRWTRCSARVRATAPRARGRPRRPSPTPHRPRAAPRPARRYRRPPRRSRRPSDS